MKGTLNEKAEVIVRWEGSTIAIVSFLESEEDEAYLLYSLPAEVSPDLISAVLLMATHDILPDEFKPKALSMIETLRLRLQDTSDDGTPF